MNRRRDSQSRELPDDDSCRHCHGSGWALKNRDGLVAVERCVCWKRNQPKLIQARLPVSLQKMTLESFDFSRVEARKAFEGMYSHPGAGYFVVGPYGAGKTHLLVGLYLKTAMTDVRTMFCSARPLNVWLTEEARGGSTALLRLAKSREPFHLFWDDIDKIKETDSRHEMMFDLLNSMVENGHKLSATSNQELKDLHETNVISPDLVRRIDEMTMYQVAVLPK